MGKSKFARADINALKEEALKFKSRTEFYKNNKAAYRRTLALDAMDEVCSHMVKYNVYNGKHGNCTISNELVFGLAKNFNTRSQFKAAHPSVYRAARQRNILQDACSHMELSGNLFKRKIYVFEHSDGTAYVGLSFNPEKRRIAHLRTNKTLIQKSKTTTQIFKILTDWLLKKEAAEKERFFIEKYRKSGWIILNKAKGGALGSNRLIWTKNECEKISKTCSTKIEFLKKNASAYGSATLHGWLNEICSHMAPSTVEPWTENELASISKSCKTRYEFKRKSPGAYKAAIRKGVLDKICSHMPKNCRILPKKDRPR